MDLIFREMRPSELDAVLSLRNEIFSPVTPQAWAREGHVTAFVAADGDELAGILPYVRRDIEIGAARSARTVFAHAVGVQSSRRGQGIGGHLLEAAAQALTGEVDALCLYRTHERSAGYRFYAQNSHVDLAYARLLERNPVSGEIPPGIEIHEGVEAICAAENELLPIFSACYAGHAGFRRREPGFHRHALSGLIFEGHPNRFFLLLNRNADQLNGYAILGFPTTPRDPAALSILEMAVLESESAGPLLEAVAALAHSLGVPAQITTSDSSPLFPALLAQGFTARSRHFVTMARVLDVEAMAARVWLEQSELTQTEVLAWTSEGDFVLHRVQNPAETLRLEMKRETLTRLLFGRLQLRAAVAMELVTAGETPEPALSAIERALPFAPWCYHGIDYI